MKVVICGVGQVKFVIARYLAGKNNDVTVLDHSPELIKKLTINWMSKPLLGKPRTRCFTAGCLIKPICRLCNPC